MQAFADSLAMLNRAFEPFAAELLCAFDAALCAFDVALFAAELDCALPVLFAAVLL